MNKSFKTWMGMIVLSVVSSLSAAQAATFKHDGSATLQVFVSFAMPKPSLIVWQEQAKHYGAVLLLRGFVNNSLKATLQQLAIDTTSNKVLQVSVDPMAFERYHITQVPAVVLAQGEKVDIVYGNIGLSAALASMSRQGELAEVAARLLEKNSEVSDDD